MIVVVTHYDGTLHYFDSMKEAEDYVTNEIAENPALEWEDFDIN